MNARASVKDSFKTAVIIMVTAVLFCFALTFDAFAADETPALQERYVCFEYGYTDCLGEVHEVSSGELSYSAGSGETYPTNYSAYMMLCDTDHIVRVTGEGVTEDNTVITSMTPAVLEIDSDGNVTLKKTGTARIKATVAADDTYAERSVYLNIKADRHTGWNDSIKVHYADRPLEWGLDLDTSDGPQQLIVPLRPGASVARYYSENSEVVTVDQSGLVTPLSAGTTQLFFEIDDGGGKYNTLKLGNTIKITGETVTPAPDEPDPEPDPEPEPEPEPIQQTQEITGNLGPFTIDWHDGLQLDLHAETALEYSISGDCGQVSQNGFVSFTRDGTAVVTVTAPASKEYKAATVTITITARDYAAEEAARIAEEEAARKAAEEEAARIAEEEAKKKAEEEAARIAEEEAKKKAEEEAAKRAEEEKAAALKAEIAKAKSLKRPVLTVKALKGKKNKLTWSKVQNADGYIVYVKYPGKKKYVKAVKKNSTVKSVTHRGLTKGKVYYYKVRAYKKVNGKIYYSPYSKIKKAKVRK